MKPVALKPSKPIFKCDWHGKKHPAFQVYDVRTKSGKYWLCNDHYSQNINYANLEKV